MKDKINDTLDKLASTPDLIEEITSLQNEYYFKVKGHSFSILKRQPVVGLRSPYSFYVYPKWSGSTSELAKAFADTPGEEPTPMLAYNSGDFTGNYFRELYSTIETKHFGVDKIFDDLLG
jgi:hypothetical protein